MHIIYKLLLRCCYLHKFLFIYNKSSRLVTNHSRRTILFHNTVFNIQNIYVYIYIYVKNINLQYITGVSFQNALVPLLFSTIRLLSFRSSRNFALGLSGYFNSTPRGPNL